MDPVSTMLQTLERKPDWWSGAECQSADPEVFFPEKGGSAREAKRICALCGVQPQCLSYALENEERFGVFGGLSERERRQLLRRRSRSVTYIGRGPGTGETRIRESA